MIAVIIPYYQRSEVPLRQALKSVAAQTVPDPLRVIIVDDASPVPAADVLKTLETAPPIDVHLVRQSNSGAAAARNAALDLVPPEARQVAFLDSDDTWNPRHLETALAAMAKGAEFYFADHRRDDWPETKLQRLGIQRGGYTCLDPSHEILAFDTDPCIPVMRDHLVQTSSVVCDADLIRELRFEIDLVIGEDEVFWVKAMRAASRCAFSCLLAVEMGRGVNISQGGSWGDRRSFELLLQNLTYWSSVHRLLPDEPELAPLQRERVESLERELARSALHRLRRLRGIPILPILRYLTTQRTQRRKLTPPRQTPS